MTTIRWTFPLVCLVMLACGGSESDDSADTDTTAGAADPATACTDLCVASGFDDGTANDYGHELNCMCTGGDGSGTIAADACTDTCLDLGWAAGEAYAADACQCS